MYTRNGRYVDGTSGLTHFPASVLGINCSADNVADLSKLECVSCGMIDVTAEHWRDFCCKNIYCKGCLDDAVSCTNCNRVFPTSGGADIAPEKGREVWVDDSDYYKISQIELTCPYASGCPPALESDERKCLFRGKLWEMIDHVNEKCALSCQECKKCHALVRRRDLRQHPAECGKSAPFTSAAVPRTEALKRLLSTNDDMQSVRSEADSTRAVFNAIPPPTNRLSPNANIFDGTGGSSSRDDCNVGSAPVISQEAFKQMQDGMEEMRRDMKTLKAEHCELRGEMIDLKSEAMRLEAENSELKTKNVCLWMCADQIETRVLALEQEASALRQQKSSQTEQMAPGSGGVSAREDFSVQFEELKNISNQLSQKLREMEQSSSSRLS